MDSLSRASSLTPCSRSATPESIPIQPDHFYGAENIQFPPSPDSDGKTWLDPADDPMAKRGIPVFKPTMDEFQDFEGFMNKVECWGSKSGIVKIIPPKEWSASLPSIKPQLLNVKIKTPIEQNMNGGRGRFIQQNIEKRKVMSVREWVELCNKEEFRAPGVHEVGLSSRHDLAVFKNSRPVRKGKQKVEKVKSESSGPASETVVIKQEPMDDDDVSLSAGRPSVTTPPNSEGSPPPPPVPNKSSKGKKKANLVKQEPKPRPKRVAQTREAREAGLAERAARDRAFLEVFDPETEWLPPLTVSSDYNLEFCKELERQYWKRCGIIRPPWYGADTQGSLFTDATTAWNVAHLPSALSRLLPSSTGLPGVNTPYLYFGMWRATFAWHVEDMDLFSINYIHFGAPKFWYAIPQERSVALEHAMRSSFEHSKDAMQCPQFLRHKSYLASPTVLGESSCKPNILVQQAGEFVVTFPRGYHAGFNLGLNCAESVNFALESWIEIGRHAKACECISDSVRIDVDELLRQREEELNPPPFASSVSNFEDSTPSRSALKGSPNKAVVKKEVLDYAMPLHRPPSKTAARKRKSDASNLQDESPKSKKVKLGPNSSSTKTMSKVSVTLKLGPRPEDQEPFPCCLCVSYSMEGLLRVQDPPITRKVAVESAGNPKVWMAHEFCARIIPETWVDELEIHGVTERVVFGVDGIIKDRWNLKCSACSKIKSKAHGAPVQCTKGKCPKAFHVNCARDGFAQGIAFVEEREVEKEVLLFDPLPPTTPVNVPQHQMQVDSTDLYNGGMALESSGSRVLKIIKKVEAKILCAQHNPAVAAQKKLNKHDKIRSELLKLPNMARIKIRISSGVFEVNLTKIIEETGSVEVLWDKEKDLRREFKWGSVILGSTDTPAPAQQKMSELVPLMQPTPSAIPVTTYPSVMAATGQQPYSVTQQSSSAQTIEHLAIPTNMNPSLKQGSQQYVSSQTPVLYPPRAGNYDQWRHTYGSQSQAYPYSFVGYPATPIAGGSQQQYYPYASYNHSGLNWLIPYHSPAPAPAPPQGDGESVQPRTDSASPAMTAQTPSNRSHYAAPSSVIITRANSNGKSFEHISRQTSQQTKNASLEPPPPAAAAETSPAAAPSNVPSNAGFGGPEHDLAALASLSRSELIEFFRANTAVRDVVMAALSQTAAGA